MKTLKKIVVFTALVLALAVMLASCKDPCSEGNHVDTNSDYICDKCETDYAPYYTVTFIYPDNTTVEKSVRHGSVLTDLPPDPSLGGGFNFVGWTYNFEQAITMDLEVRPNVSGKTFSITYMGPCGSNTSLYTAGSSFEFKNHGYGDYYYFCGWYFDEELTVPAVVTPETYGDLKLWPEVYFLPFEEIVEDGNEVQFKRPFSNAMSNYFDGDEYIIPEKYNGKDVVSVSFVGLDKIETLVLPKTVREVELGDVGYIKVAEDNATYKSVDGSLYSKDGTTLYRICGKADYLYTVLPGTKTIAFDAIRTTSHIFSITLPESLENIETGKNVPECLDEVYNLSSLDVETNIGSRALVIHTSLADESIFTREGDFIFSKRGDRNYLFKYTGDSTSVVLPDSFKGGDYGLYGKFIWGGEVTELTISSGVKYATRGSVGNITLEKLILKNEGAITYDPLLGSGSEEDIFIFLSAKNIYADSIMQWMYAGAGAAVYEKTSLYIDGEILSSLTIPEGVSEIPNGAFKGLQGITSLTLPSTLKKIGWDAFSGTGITELELPDGLTTIEPRAFYNCKSLTTVRMPSSVDCVSRSSFEKCNLAKENDGSLYVGNWLISADLNQGFNSLVIREGTVGIAEEAGFYITAKSITIPSSVKYIGYRAFNYASNLETINFNAKDAKVFGGEDDDWYFSVFSDSQNGRTNFITLNVGKTVERIDDLLFSYTYYASMPYYPRIKNISFESGSVISEIGDRAFYGVGTLESISLPVSLRKIGEEAFAFCSGVTSVRIESGVTEIGRCAFGSLSSLTDIYYNAVSAQAHSGPVYTSTEGPFSRSDNVVTVTIGRNVSEINTCTFFSANVGSIIFESGSVLSTIGDHAFGKNSLLTSVTLPDYTDTLGEYAFASCTNLYELNGRGLVKAPSNAVMSTLINESTFGNEVYGNIKYRFSTPVSPVSNDITWAALKPGTNLPDGFFSDCLSLIHVYIPDGCTLGAGIFGVHSTSELSYRLALRVLFESVYSGSSEWRKVYENGSDIFRVGMIVDVSGTTTSLGSIDSGIKLTEKGLAYAVTDASPDYITVYGYFGSSSSLTVPAEIDGVTVYDMAENAFAARDGITEVVIESCEISAGAFTSSSVKIVTLSDTKKVGDFAFYGCTSLQSVTFGYFEEICVGAFSGCTSLSRVQLGSARTENSFIRDSAFEGCTSLYDLVVPENIYTIGANAFSDSGLESFTVSGESVSFSIISGASSSTPTVVTTYTPDSEEEFAEMLTETYKKFYFANNKYFNA